MPSQFSSFFVGIDVSKDSLDVCVVGRAKPRHWRVRQRPEALAELVRELLSLAPAGIVVEHTGGYQNALVDALAEADLPVVVMNPKRIRDFARSEGILAKNDRLDAAVLALFAAKIQPSRRPLPSAAQRALAALTAYQQKLVADRAALRVQLQRAEQDVIRASLARRIAQLDEECRQLEAEIDNRIAASPPSTSGRCWRARPRASGRRRRARSRPSCPSWAASPTAPSRPSPGWPPSPTTAASITAGAASAAAASASDACSI